jgi:hypothetical protein
MPSASNPDPHGYIMQMAQSQAENTVDPKPSVANLLSPSKKPILDKELETETEVPKEPEVKTA